MAAMTERIRRKIEAHFAPQSLEVIDESEQHRGHAQWREGGETHFYLRLVSERFSGQSRIARQRAVYSVLAEEMAGGVHALRMALFAPEEVAGA